MTNLNRTWARFADRDKAPRRWWYPRYATPSYETTPLRDLHEKCSETISRVMIVLLGFAMYCLLTALGSDDTSLLKSNAEIKIPFAEAPVSFSGFLVVGPFLLIVILVYLHVFVAYWRELDAIRVQQQPSQVIDKLPALFNLDHIVPRCLTVFIFYWLTPLILAVITWKALARPEWGFPIG